MRDGEAIAEKVSRAQRELVIAAHHLGPAAFDHSIHEFERGRNAQHRGRIEGAGPVEFEMEAAAIGALGIRAVADHDGTDSDAAIFADVEKRRAFRSADPLVEIAGVVVGIESGHIERDRHQGRKR